MCQQFCLHTHTHMVVHLQKQTNRFCKSESGSFDSLKLLDEDRNVFVLWRHTLHSHLTHSSAVRGVDGDGFPTAPFCKSRQNKAGGSLDGGDNSLTDRKTKHTDTRPMKGPWTMALPQLSRRGTEPPSAGCWRPQGGSVHVSPHSPVLRRPCFLNLFFLVPRSIDVLWQHSWNTD